MFDGRSIEISPRSKAEVAQKSLTHGSVENWSAHRLRCWAKQVGPATLSIVDTILLHSKESQKGKCSCLGVLSLASQYGGDRLETASKRALANKSWTIKGLRESLKLGLDKAFVQLSIKSINLP